MPLNNKKGNYFQCKVELSVSNYRGGGYVTLVEGAIIEFRFVETIDNMIIFRIIENVTTINSKNGIGAEIICSNDLIQEFFEDCNYIYKVSRSNCIRNARTGQPKLSWSHNANDNGKPKYNYTFTHLCSLFKYIPIKYISGYESNNASFEGFYDVERNIGIRLNNIVELTPKVVKKPNGFTRRDKKKIVKSKQCSKKPISNIINNIDASRIIDEYYDLSILLKYCKFKLIGYQYSSDLYGRVNQKKLLVGKLLMPSKDKEIELFQIVPEKLETEYMHSMYFNTEFGNLKFDLRDIEIIYPNIKGYHIPFNRKISIGDVVKCVSPKNIGKKLSLKEEVIVVDIKYLGDNKKYIGWVKSYSDKNITYSDIKAFRKYVVTTLKTKEIAVLQTTASESKGVQPIKQNKSLVDIMIEQDKINGF